MPLWPIFVHCAVGSGLVLRHALHNNVMNKTTTKIFPYLERLLDGEDVEWKTLGDKEYISIENNARKAVNSRSRIPGETPYYGANNIQDYVEGYTHDGVYILIAEDGTASIEQYSIQWAEGKFWANNHVHVIRGTEKINNRFLYYILKTVNFTPFLVGGGRAKLTKAKLQEIPFAVPPLRVQARIVEILDKFTQLEAQLEAELEAELEARRKQYAYYRDQLLNFSQYSPLNVNIEWRTLGEVCKIKNGKDYKHLSHGDIPVYGSGGIMKYVDEATYNQPSVLIPRKGSLNNLFYVDMPFWNVDTIYYTEINTNHILPKFLYHYLATRELEKMNLAGGVPSLTQTTLKRIPIPIPPLSEQRRIVDILDRFDTLTNSISEGLPKEIALRRKQYAYYRDALLSFPRPEVSA